MAWAFLSKSPNSSSCPYSPKCLEGGFSELRCSNLRAAPRRGSQTPRRMSAKGVIPSNFVTNIARKCSKVLRLATLNFVENFSSAPLELFLLWLLSHIQNAQQRRVRAWLIV